ncbi:MAG: IPT/TIG domain-containing protein [Myxococcota bacterium]|nr:IPT/TIG domain-containing protein [Myxococcota bacterium]
MLRPPEVALGVRRAVVDPDGDIALEPVAPDGRISNGDQFVEVVTRFTVGGQAPPPVDGLVLHGRFTTTSNLGEQVVPFAIPPGERLRVVELRAAFPEAFDVFESLRLVRRGFVEAAAAPDFAADRRLPIALLDAESEAPVDRFEFDVVNVTATPPDAAGRSRVAGSADTAAAASEVTVLNTASSLAAAGTAADDGGFAVELDAQAGDALRVFFTDVAGAPDVVTLEVPSAVPGVGDPVASLRADPPEATLTAIGDRFTLRALALTAGGAGRRLGPEDGAVYESGNPSVAVVRDDGVVIARGAGETFVEIRVEGSAARARVTVDPPPAPTIGLLGASADYGAGIGRAPGRGRVGDTVVIRGSGFAVDPFAHTVTFAGAEATVLSGDAEQLVVRIPAGAVTGRLQVTAGEQLSDTTLFTITDGPVLTGAEDSMVRVGETVRVFGVGFAPLAADNQIALRAEEQETIVPVSSTDGVSLSFAMPDLPDSPVLRVVVSGRESNPIQLNLVTRVAFRVELPPGLGLAPQELDVRAGMHAESTPNASGDVDVDLVRGVPTLVTAKDAAGNVVLIGVGDASEPLSQELSPRSVADFLVYFTVALTALPPGGFAEIFPRIHAQTGALGDRIFAGLDADPNYMAGAASDPAFAADLEQAVSDAIDAVAAHVQSLGPVQAQRWRASSSLFARLLDAAVPAAHAQDTLPENIPETVEPNEFQSGLAITELAPDTTKVTVSNRYFRFVSAKIEDTSVEPEPGSSNVLLEHVGFGALLGATNSVISPARKIPSSFESEEIENFLLEGFTTPNELEALRDFEANGGPYRLELIGPSATGLISPVGLLGFESDELESADQINAYIITTFATWVKEFAIPVLELIIGSKASGDDEKIFKKVKSTLSRIVATAEALQALGTAAASDERQSGLERGWELFQKLQDVFTAANDGKGVILTLFDTMEREISGCQDSSDCTLDDLSDFGEGNDEFCPTIETPRFGRVNLCAVSLLQSIIQDVFNEGEVPLAEDTETRQFFLDRMTDLATRYIPGVAQIRAAIGAVKLLILGANTVKAVRDIAISEPLVEFTFTISVAEADRLEPSAAEQETVEGGELVVVLHGRGFNPHLDSYIDMEDLDLPADGAFRSCQQETPPLLFERFESIATRTDRGIGRVEGPCQSLADLFDRGRKNYIAFPARPGPGVAPDGYVLAPVRAIRCPGVDSCVGASPTTPMEVELLVPPNAYSGSLLYRNKRERLRGPRFTVRSNVIGQRAFVTNLTGPDFDLPGGLSVVQVDPVAGQVSSPVPIEYPGVLPFSIALHPNGLSGYVADLSDRMVYELDLTRERVVRSREARVGPGPTDVAVSPSGNLMLVNQAYAVTVIDPRTMQVVTSIPVDFPGQPGDFAPRSVAFRPDARRAYALYSEEGGFGYAPRRIGFVAVIDTDELAADSESFLTVLEVQEIPRMDEPAVFRPLDDTRAFVVGRGMKRIPNSDGSLPPDIIEYDISSEPIRDGGGRRDSIDTPAPESFGPGGGPPPPARNVDQSNYAPIDIAFDPTGGPFAYLPSHYSGNVSVFAVRDVPEIAPDLAGFVLGITRSDFRAADYQDLAFGLDFIPIGFVLGVVPRVDVVSKQEIITRITSPRRVAMSHNGEFALVTRNAAGGDAVLILDDAMHATIDWSYENPEDGLDLSDLAVECLAGVANGTGFQGDCAASDFSYLNRALPAAPGASLQVPAVAGWDVGPKPQDVATERLVGIVAPTWGTCVTEAIELDVWASEVVEDVRFRLEDAGGTLVRDGRIIGARGDVRSERIEVGGDTPLPDGEYRIEVTGEVEDQDSATADGPVFIDNAPPVLLETTPMEGECVGEPFDFVARYDAGGPTPVCNRIVECRLLVNGRLVGELRNPPGNECRFEGLDPEEFDPRLEITLFARDAAGNETRDERMLFRPDFAITGPSVVPVGTTVRLTTIGTPGDGVITLMASGDYSSFTPTASATTVTDRELGGATLRSPAAPGVAVITGTYRVAEGCEAEAEPHTVRFEGCGDGAVEGEEECDDFGTEDGDGCDSMCRIEMCGNAVIQTGEECDDGEDNADDEPNACREDCTEPFCGDLVVDDAEPFFEECDDGAANSDDEPNACRTSCQLARCGDEVVDDAAPLFEACDEGSANSDSDPNTCRTDCREPSCGDGVVDDAEPYFEDCDDGNTDDGDECPADCRAGLRLEPRLVFGLGLCGPEDREVHVLEVPGRVEITSDEDVDYEWIGNGLSEDVARELIDALSELLVDGEIEVAITPIEVEDGVVTFTDPSVAGINVIRARRRDEVSNFSLVIGGMELAALGTLEISPVSLGSIGATALRDVINDTFEEAELPDVPMVLFSSGPTCGGELEFVGTDGLVKVDRLTFDFFGGLIEGVDFIEVVGDFIDYVAEAAAVEAGPAAPVILFLGEVAQFGTEVAISQFLDFEVSSEAASHVDGDGPVTNDGIIEVADQASLSPLRLNGQVSALASGISGIQATLDLEAYCLGKATDGMLVVVAPELQAADVRNESGNFDEDATGARLPTFRLVARGPDRNLSAVGLFGFPADQTVAFDPLGLVDAELSELVRGFVPGDFELDLDLVLPPGAMITPASGTYEEGAFYLSLDVDYAVGAAEFEVGDLRFQTILPDLLTLQTWTPDDPGIATLDDPDDFLRDGVARGISEGITPGRADVCVPFAGPERSGTRPLEVEDLCGNDRIDVEALEQCDDGNRLDGDGCDRFCRNTCGNAVPDPGEECDDGNRVDGDGCDNNCTSSRCGNGVRAAGEQCDDGNTVDGDGCDAECFEEACGNGRLQAMEECDDGNRVGGDRCDPDCFVETCGNGRLQAGEECDDGNDVDGDGCDAGCRTTRCGNGVVTAGEECDEGRETATCNADCTAASCGDGVVNASAGEACDDAGESALCNADCTAARCGDAVWNPSAGEECDEGPVDTASCDASDCTAARCGDGTRNLAAGEACDDGNLADGDGCDSNCTETACGNGVVTAGEQCDDGNLADGDGCDALCRDEVCGNGIVQAGESCDDAGESPTCDADCTPALCGDGIVNPTAGELCDDAGDSLLCDADCTPAACGDGTLNPVAGERCDDGNTLDGDGCSSLCRIEPGSRIVQILLTEVVTDPRSDWSDSAGGVGGPYTAPPGTGAVDDVDQYVELHNTGSVDLNIEGLRLRMVDASPETYVLGSETGGTVEVYVTATRANAFAAGGVVVIGNPPGTLDDVVFLELVTEDGLVLDDVQIGAGGAPAVGETGASSGPSDEAIFRVTETDDDAVDFERGPGTPGVF